MNQAKKLLIVEDDENIAELLQLHLRKEGFDITHAADGNTGMEKLRQGGWDALILDLMLPGVDGLEICRFARTMTRYTPIVIISARSGETQRVLGLELGADDYLPKPFSMLELVARVKALFRRQEAMSRNLRLDAGVLTFDTLSIDPLARMVQLNQQAVDLTPREFDLLYFFARNPDTVFSRLNLLNEVWGYEHEGYEHTVNTHINRLRIKIEDNPAEPNFIRTVWGKGYKFTARARE
ncbi:response regulator transcription factor [Enterobacter sp. R1(2018)]|uniref:response regulator transcription factor n=1 Tax=Enterobacter sp. R1(2018) TaxID=2447891 RepID=UPI000EAF3CBD|nr:response regulator transcription factor [Enterobacter sp. R1(2018)]RKQ41466.1 DNA-binding response regulator [Enterobacter sp. R1(2018)]